MRIILPFFLIASFFFISCEKVQKPNSVEEFPYKQYELNEYGGIVNTDFKMSDFEEDLQNCRLCHEDHYDEWSQSMHAYSMKDPIFFSGWKEVQSSNHFPETGERFCIQCHSPVAFLTGTDLSDVNSMAELMSNFDKTITDGVSCNVCHSMTSLSNTVHTGDDVAANAEYYMYPGEGVQYGSIEDPEYNYWHESEFNPIFNQSEFCFPCHDLTMRGVEAEMTITEWSRIPGLAMSGALSCQDCHMPLIVDEDGYHHNHKFVGVDIDLSYPIGASPLHGDVQNMLQSAADLKFGYLTNTMPDTMIVGDSLFVPITVTSRTAHGLPSGTSFSREAWINISIVDENGMVLYESGSVENHEELDLLDPNLLLFTSNLLDENGNEVSSVTQAYQILDDSLPAFQSKYHSYGVGIPPEISGMIYIDVKMLFRAFKPYMLIEYHSDLLQNLPIFEIASIQDSIYIKSSQ